jgi:transposase
LINLLFFLNLLCLNLYQKFKFVVNENPNANVNKEELKLFMQDNDIKDINIFLNLLNKEEIKEKKDITTTIEKFQKEPKSKFKDDVIEILKQHEKNTILWDKKDKKIDAKYKKIEKEIEERKTKEENVEALKNKLNNKTENKPKEKYVNEKLKKILIILKEKFGEDAMKIYRKKITRKSRLNKRVKFVLQMLSHYSFRQHLNNKCIEYGCHMEVVTEEFTSKTCTNCGEMGNNFTKRTKKCSNCNYTINRDIGGARNIMIKNLDLVKL